MVIPKTTPEKPYIEFKFDNKGKLTLSSSSSWWGGKHSGFISSNGSGNTCEPKHLKEYIKAFKEKEVKEVEKEIKVLQKKLKAIKSKHNL